MGISGLIPFLEKASSRVHMKDLHGCTVAIDTYCWLHKGAFGCAEKLVRGEDTDQYWKYCMRYLDMLLSYNIKPILVFDGQHLPAKALTEKRRRENRQQSRQLAAELLRKGKAEEARAQMRRCVDITHEMALKLIHECRLRNIDCIVAPYEADAQMAWLNKVEIAQYVITEDSDLTLFGAKRIIFKLDLAGAGLLVDADKLHLAMGCQRERYNFEKFRRMCILSGCDYLDSLPGIGLAKACKFILKTEEDDMWLALKKIPSTLNMRNLQVDNEYIEQFLKAEATFKHMYIYNPFKRCMERLNELAEYQTDERYCMNAGTPIDDKHLALQLAVGNLNPLTLKQLDHWHPDSYFGLAQVTNKDIKRTKHKSIWQKNYLSNGSVQQETEVKKSDNCALYFKKVDFISKTIEQEITTNEDCAKPEESEIFSMYQQEVEELIEPNSKRQRFSDMDEATENNEGNGFEPFVTNKTTHNPFAKDHTNIFQKTYKKATVCENASLLRVLSPKKSRSEEIARRTERVNEVKQNWAKLEEKVTVKSRFFAVNIEETKKSTTLPVKRNLCNEIEAIENHAQLEKETRSQLYDLLSPKKVLIGKHIDFVLTEKCNKSPLAEDQNIKQIESVEKIDDTECVNSVDTNIVGDDNTSDVDAAITLSDDEFDDTSTPKGQVISASLMAFKSQGKQRLGLTKTKTKLSLKSNKAKGNATTQNSLQNQTRLTMFGFKKRPSLK